MNLKEEIKKRFVLFAIVILLVCSIGLNVNSYSKIDTIGREIMTTTVGFEPTHECKGKLDSNDETLKYYCFSLSSTLKTCYTLPAKKGGKRCLIEPYWEEIIYEDGECPICKCPLTECPRCPITDIICPVPPSCPSCIQTCAGCGSGGGSSGSCPPCIACDAVNVIAYVNDENGLTKWFCPGIGKDVNCINKDLEMCFD